MSEYYEKGVAKSVDDLYLRLTSLMTSNGWTLLDTISDSVDYRDKVFRSSPLDATALNYAYVRLSWIGAGWTSYTYTDWDPVTHQGSTKAGLAGSNTFNTGGSPVHYWIRVNEFAATYAARTVTSVYYLYAGYLIRGLSAAKNGLTRTTQAYSSGSSVLNVASDMTGKLQVNQKVVIYNHGHSSGSSNFSNAELLTVQSVASGSITFTTPTTLSYDAGAVIGWNPHPSVVNWLNTGSDWVNHYFYGTMLHDGTGTSPQVLFYPVMFSSESYADPDDISQEYQGGVVSGHFGDAGKTGFHGYMYHWRCNASPTTPIAMEEVLDNGSWKDIVLMPYSSSYVYAMRAS